jgi:ABC-2 type transport system permease protein
VVSFGMTVVFLVLCMLVVRWIFRTGYNIKA